MHDPWKNMARPSVLETELDPTPARPEPWFVGSGRGLMIVVLLACAVLIGARVVQLVQISEAAWVWLNTPVRSSPLPPAPPLPPSSRSIDAREWFAPDDYPAAAIRAEADGRTRVEIRFGRNGMPKACRTIASSGHASLDRATCTAAIRRAKVSPVSAEMPEPVSVKAVTWRLPPP